MLLIHFDRLLINFGFGSGYLTRSGLDPLRNKIDLGDKRRNSLSSTILQRMQNLNLWQKYSFSCFTISTLKIVYFS